MLNWIAPKFTPVSLEVTASRGFILFDKWCERMAKVSKVIVFCKAYINPSEQIMRRHTKLFKLKADGDHADAAVAHYFSYVLTILKAVNLILCLLCPHSPLSP